MKRLLSSITFFSFYALLVVSDAIPNTRTNILSVDVDQESGGYKIYVKGAEWFRSGDVFFHANSQRFTTADGSLKLSTFHEEEGEDSLGTFSRQAMTFVANNAAEMLATISTYDGFIVFEQQFSEPITQCSTGNADTLSSGFPTFQIHNKEQRNPTGYAHWVSWFYDTTVTPEDEMEKGGRRRMLVAPGFLTPSFGPWSDETLLFGGIGGTGVTCIYDDKAETVAVLSPMDNVMAMSQYSPSAGSVQFGIMGNVTAVPSKVAFKTMLYVGQDGINEAMSSWGTIMRSYFGKPNAAVSRTTDVTLQYLGYTTDNGMYYYYNTEPNHNYEETLVGVKKYADSEQIPYKYILLDSWWYYKGENGGVSDWTAMPDIFPNGIEALYNATGWLVQAHNRYWALDNVYSKTNGGSFEFVEDTVKEGSVPVQESLWKQLLEGPSKNWGLAVYEQDWLYNEFYQYVGQFLESVSLGHLWLKQMGSVAAENGLTIQYCMPHIRHLLASLEVTAVTQARASDDYVVAPYDGVNFDNWRIGGQSMLMDALGLAPSKDGFWSTTNQPGNPYGDERHEPYPRLQAAVTTLSAGPIAIGDAIEYSDATLIMKSCRKDGRLLQPSFPATQIDAQMLRSTLDTAPSTSADPSLAGPSGEVWFASTEIGSTLTGFVFVADLKESWSIRPSDVFKGKRQDKASLEYVIRESNTTTSVSKWSESEPLTLQACSFGDFALWTTAPVLSSNWAFLGELDKWVSISAARFETVVPTLAGGAMAKAVGPEGEVLNVGFVSPQMDVVQVSCTIGEKEYVLITSEGKCIV